MEAYISTYWNSKKILQRIPTWKNWLNAIIEIKISIFGYKFAPIFIFSNILLKAFYKLYLVVTFVYTNLRNFTEDFETNAVEMTE